MRVSDVTQEQIFKAFEKHDYIIHKEPYRLNLFGVRDPSNLDSFNDVVGCFYYDDSQKLNFFPFTATTDPGLKMLKAPINSKGCAVLLEGQYIDTWIRGLHHGKYIAYVEHKKVAVVRSKHFDGKLNYEVGMNGANLDVGMFGINIHHAGSHSILVDSWSAGCQVIADIKDWNKLISFQDLADEHGFPLFTYTLLTLDQYKNS